MKLRVANTPVYCYSNGRDIQPDRETVIFVHGAGMDHTVWTPFARHFARHQRNVVAVDLPGHGRSAGQPLDSVEAIADWLVELMNTLSVQQAAIIGHSLGSLVALDFAARYPERCRTIALIGTAVPMPVSEALLTAAEANDHAAFDMLAHWGLSARHEYGGNQNPGVWMVGSSLRLLERCRPGVLHADMIACNSYRDGLTRAASVTCPVLVVLGQNDRMTPVRNTGPLLEALPSPQVEIVAGAGHSLMIEASNSLLDALKKTL